MDPSAYVPAYLERSYLDAHPELTPAARELVHDDVWQRPEKYAVTEHAQALVAYARTHAHLLAELDRMEDLPDEEFERRRGQLFDETRLALAKIVEADRLVVDAHLVAAMLSDMPLDDCISDLMKIEARAREYLEGSDCGFDIDAPHFWTREALESSGLTEAQLTQSDPMMIGWLHALEAISQLCLATARYKAASSYARCVMRAAGYPSHAEGTVMLALARLEDEDGFFEFVRELHSAEDAEGPGAEAKGAPHAFVPEDDELAAVNRVPVDDSPWFLLARTLLLFKSGRERPARRARAAAGYPNHAEGTVLLALARLEDEEGFFAFAHELSEDAGADGADGLTLDDSPWYLLARTILLYKLDKRRAAQRALRTFTERCDGGAFFILNPTYLDPYLPVRPAPHNSWDLAHQAVWEAEGAVYDTPDFVPWAETVEGIFDASELFAERHGF